MFVRIRKYCNGLFFCVAASFFLTGCFDEERVAPVVNAWYQKGAASDFYIVQTDDTIYSIAFAFGLDYRALALVNHLASPYALVTGQRLVMTHEPPTKISPKAITYAQKVPIVAAEGFMATWEWPTHGRLVQRFSTRPDGHRGISIGGRLGQPIRAASRGIVVYSGEGVRGYGNLIIVKHNDTYMSAYAFNEKNLVVTGDHVHAGQLIARMGQNDAGRTQLYFEIRQNGMPIDPLKFFYK